GSEHQMRGMLSLVQQTKPLFTGAQRILHAFAFGYVDRSAEPLLDLAALVEQGHGARMYPAEAAIRQLHAMFEIERLLGANGLLDPFLHPRLLDRGNIRMQPVSRGLRGIARKGLSI